jgi:hypothetical protein
MELRIHLTDRVDSDLGGELGVQGAHNSIRVEQCTREGHDLLSGMDAAIGSTCHVRTDIACPRRKRGLELPLNGS